MAALGTKGGGRTLPVRPSLSLIDYEGREASSMTVLPRESRSSPLCWGSLHGFLLPGQQSNHSPIAWLVDLPYILSLRVSLCREPGLGARPPSWPRSLDLGDRAPVQGLCIC